jgi:3-hydroxyacyl-[acyl-carrier-protein] dehydratase
VSGGALVFEAEELLRLLSHRRPQLLIDRVIALVPGRSGVALKSVTGNESGLAKRLHGFVFPATLAFEALAQLAGVVLSCQDATHAKSPTNVIWLPSAIERLEIERELTVADRLTFSVQVTERCDPQPNDLAPNAAPAALGSLARIAGQAYFSGLGYVSAQFVMQPLSHLEPYRRRADGY